jgi:hypothetical protein
LAYPKLPTIKVGASIPLDIQREGLSLSSLQTSLRGRWRGNCHTSELGAALRKLGFTRQRRSVATFLSIFSMILISVGERDRSFGTNVAIDAGPTSSAGLATSLPHGAGCEQA